MPNGFALIDLIFILALGIFIVSRFFSVKLPKDDKSKKRPQSMQEIFISDLEATQAVSPALRPKPQPLPDLQGLEGVTLIRKADPRFDEKEFLQGAQEAYHMFYDARRTADKELLRQLLSPKLEKQFLAEVEDYAGKGQTLAISVEKIISAEIVGTRMNGKTAVIDVAYQSKIKNPTQDGSGKTVKGSEVAKSVKEIFTWARNIDAEDLNWELVDIKQAN
jgi:predicted lipid-binding transport protein (Tim44 family)